MGRDDWYRCTAWSPEERDFFEQKLGRANRASRPGYLRVQGTLLSRSEDDHLRAVGRELLARAIEADDSDRPIEGHWARMNLAGALTREGALDEAERLYRECARNQEEHAGFGLNGDCHLGLAEVLLRRSPGDRESAEEAAAALDKAADLNPPLFHADRWRFCAALARVAATRDEPERAREWAEQALAIAEIDAPQLPRHPGVGLAVPATEEVREMERLAGRGPR